MKPGPNVIRKRVWNPVYHQNSVTIGNTDGNTEPTKRLESLMCIKQPSTNSYYILETRPNNHELSYKKCKRRNHKPQEIEWKTTRWNRRQRDGVERNEMEWKTRPMLGAQRIYLQQTRNRTHYDENTNIPTMLLTANLGVDALVGIPRNPSKIETSLVTPFIRILCLPRPVDPAAPCLPCCPYT
jgi:hypothetical protein